MGVKIQKFGASLGLTNDQIEAYIENIQKQTDDKPKTPQPLQTC